MCDQHLGSGLPDPDPNTPQGPDRRQVLRRGAGLLAVAALQPGLASRVGGRAYADTSDDGLLAVPMAMHVHGSFSEGTSGVVASWETQLDEARQAGIAVLWPTDHDWRMSAFRAPDVFHTAGLHEVVQHRAYSWRPQGEGALAASTATASPALATPADPAQTKGGLRLSATSAGSAPASQRLVLDGSASDYAQKTNLAGQRLHVQVQPLQVNQDAWGELLLTLAHHPARAGRPAGVYQLSYRFGPEGGPPQREGLLGIVPVAVRTQEWNEVTLRPDEDAAAVWPDLVADDNSLCDLWFGATSQGGAPADVVFAYLRIGRSQADGDTPLAVQSRLLDAYRGQFPDVVVRHGLELSVNDAHTNNFGGRRRLPDYGQGRAASFVDGDADAYAAWSAQQIHGWGGLASLNHVFGSHARTQTTAQQTAHRHQIARRLLPTRAFGMDLLEVGYRVRGGATLEQHLALWDTLSRAGTWLTGNGVNDSHGGREVSWRQLNNRFSTTVLAASTSEADLLAALRSGRAYVGELGSFAGLLEIRSGECPMGSVSVQPGVGSRPLTITATHLPSGSSVQVVQSPVDDGSSLDPAARVVAELPARAFRGGTSTVVLDTTRSCFARVQVVSASGRVVAFSNPVWLLQQQPPVPVPAARRSPDSAA